MKILKLFFLFLLLKLSSLAQSTDKLYAIRNYCQDFQFIQIDCANDSLTVLSQLPNFYHTPYFSSAYDAANQKYYLTYGQNLEVINAITGHVDTIYVFTTINPNYFIHIVFNPIDGFIYGIKYNQATFVEMLSKFNPANGSLTDLFPIVPTVKTGIGCKASFDPYLGEYYIQSRSLASINIHTGQVLYNRSFQNPTNEWLDHFAYSCRQQRFFGLTNNYHSEENYFSEIDTSTGITSRINSLPLPTYFYKQYLSGSTIDNSSDIYYYAAARGKLYGIDINTGNVVYDHDFGPDYQFLLLESASPISCLSDGIAKVNSILQTEVFPNPSNGIFTFNFKNSNSKKLNLEIYNLSGQLLKTEVVTREKTFELDLSASENGIYFYKLKGEDSVVMGKLVKEE